MLEGIEEREGRENRLTTGVGEGEGSVRCIEPGTVGMCIRVSALSGGQFNSSMLRMTASDSVS